MYLTLCIMFVILTLVKSTNVEMDNELAVGLDESSTLQIEQENNQLQEQEEDEDKYVPNLSDSLLQEDDEEEHFFGTTASSFTSSPTGLVEEDEEDNLLEEENSLELTRFRRRGRNRRRMMIRANRMKAKKQERLETKKCWDTYRKEIAENKKNKQGQGIRPIQKKLHLCRCKANYACRKRRERSQFYKARGKCMMEQRNAYRQMSMDYNIQMRQLRSRRDMKKRRLVARAFGKKRRNIYKKRKECDKCARSNKCRNQGFADEEAMNAAMEKVQTEGKQKFKHLEPEITAELKKVADEFTKNLKGFEKKASLKVLSKSITSLVEKVLKEE